MLDIPLMSNNITREDTDVLVEFIQTTDHYTNGIKVKEFERAWSEWLGVKYTVFVNSGSSANFISMAVLRDLYGHGEVIVPPITWSSDVGAVIAAGMTPVFADIDFKNLAMAENEILDKINSNTKAVFLTHVLGFNGLTDSLLRELGRLNIPLIEDVCESHGAVHNGRKCGAWGLASNFSFYYAHHMSSIEGGAICTNDNDFYQHCLLYRSHGMLREVTDENLKEETLAQCPDLNQEFLFLVPGYNMRSTELNAVIALNQLKRLDVNNEKRRKNFKLFLGNLDKNKYFTDFDSTGSCNYAFVIFLRDGNQEKFKRLCEALKAENVEFRRGTAGGGNMARQPFVRRIQPDFDPASLKNADKINFYALYTGNYPDLEKEKILALCRLLNQI